MTAAAVLRVEDLGSGIRRLLIDRPQARNAIDADVRTRLHEALAAAAEDNAVRALVIGGAGGMFCAGGDLPSMLGLSPAAARARMAQGHAIVARLWHFPKPVVVAVEKFAVGAGAGLALLGDRIVMGETAVLGFPFMRLGLVPDWGLMTTLPWRAGATPAARIFTDAGNVSAADALAAGVIDEVVAGDAVSARTLAVATAMAALPHGAFRRMKLAMRSLDLVGALAVERDAQVACLGSAEFTEGYAAFREKRSADFTTAQGAER